MAFDNEVTAFVGSDELPVASIDISVDSRNGL